MVRILHSPVRSLVFDCQIISEHHFAQQIPKCFTGETARAGATSVIFGDSDEAQRSQSGLEDSTCLGIFVVLWHFVMHFVDGMILKFAVYAIVKVVHTSGKLKHQVSFSVLSSC